MTVPARATAALAALDDPLNALEDATARRFPWAWWPVDPPRRDRPWGRREHAVYLAWSVAGFGAGEVLIALAPEHMRSSGTRLQVERAVTAGLTVAVWLLAAGAWDRRAADLRRHPWRRLTGSR